MFLIGMSPNCKHLIAIGDHKQLRPKLDSYKLTVESGEGYKFNRSLFERLALSDFPLVTLNLQHRMRPEISRLIRQMTYPELKDAEKTHGRPDISGVQANVLFINHDFEEGSDDLMKKSELEEDAFSKINPHESRMVAKMVEYLLRQGYQGNEIVVLTPYLAQLRLLKKELEKITSVSLSDLDVADFVKLGVDPELSIRNKTSQAKPSVRVSTVDNYQGEEADIVIASLVRGNPNGSIGFVGQPERVNVLLSRARNGMFLIGNKKTLSKRSEVWNNVFQLLTEDSLIFSGFPICCNVHNRTVLLERPIDFEKCHKPGNACSCLTFS